jgi:hypothetical protein
MSSQVNKEKSNKPSTVTTTNTNLPGLRDVKVIVSQPSLIKENSSKINKK